MKRNKFRCGGPWEIAGCVLFVGAVVGLGWFGRGPEGSVPATVVEERIAAAGASCGWKIADSEPVAAEMVPLSGARRLKRSVKAVLGLAGLTTWTQGNATAFLLQDGLGREAGRCYVRRQGDLVVAVRITTGAGEKDSSLEKFAGAL